ncbi:MAG TPA: Ig-like domain-containing protein, partial [Vicinamibacterales bacterium]|nr:Ig-like domain-containing protein [Vicinamibacterales bacterium]
GTETFSLTGTLNASRLGGAAVRLTDGRVLLAGGQVNGPGGVTPSAEIYTPSTTTWSPANGLMSRSRQTQAAVLLNDGRVLLVGGSGPLADVAHTADLFDPNSSTFSAAGPLADDHVDAFAALLPNGKVAIVGGSGTTTSIEEFDPSTNTFTRVADLTVGRGQPGVATLGDGRVLVTGGVGAASQLLSSAEVYTPSGVTHITLAGTDAETASFNLSFTVIGSPLHGSLSGIAPNLVYTPILNYNGSDSFQFTVTDRGGPDNCGTPSPTCAASLTSAAATVSIVVRPVNDAPTANANSVSTNENTPVAVTLTGSDVETNSGSLTFTVTTQPQHGVLSGLAPNLTYTPSAGYTGPDGVTFTVTDVGDPNFCGTPSSTCAAPLTSSPATVTINVAYVPPTLLGPEGGTGGSNPYAISCSPAAYATGFRIATGSGLDYALTGAILMCSDANDQTIKSFPGGAIEVDEACAPGERMVGFLGDTGYGNGYVIEGVGARCRPTSGPVYSTGTAPTTWTPFGPLDCPAGQVVVGAQGTTGAVVDNVTLICGVRP